MASHTIIRCMGELRIPCPAEFRSASSESVISAQLEAAGWKRAKTRDGIRYLCSMHAALGKLTEAGAFIASDVAIPADRPVREIDRKRSGREDRYEWEIDE